MEQPLQDHIKLLLKDGETFERINISILFSLNRNAFFRHLKNYIDFYNRLKSKLRATYPKGSVEYDCIERIPELHFEDYSVNWFRWPDMLMAYFEWGYIKEVKGKIKTGLKEFELFLNKDGI